MTTLTPGELYQVNIPGRGNGTVEIVRHMKDGLVDSTVIHGYLKNRTAKHRKRGDGDPLCFYANGEGVTIRPIELKGD